MPLPVILGGVAVVDVLLDVLAALGLRSAAAALLEYAAVVSVRVTAAAGWARNMVAKAPRSSAAIASFIPFEDLWEASGRVYSEVEHYAINTVDGWLGYWVEGLAGSRPKSWDREGLLNWVGKMAAAKVNAQTGWKFTSLYPPEKIGQEVAAMVGGGIINGTGKVGTLQVMAQSQVAQHAVAIKNKALEEYKGRGTKKKAAWLVKQKLWRNTHPQIIVPYSNLKSPAKAYITNKYINKMVARKSVVSYQRRVAELTVTIANLQARVAATSDVGKKKALNYRLGRKIDEKAYVQRMLTAAIASAAKLGV